MLGGPSPGSILGKMSAASSVLVAGHLLRMWKVRASHQTTDVVRCWLVSTIGTSSTLKKGKNRLPPLWKLVNPPVGTGTPSGTVPLNNKSLDKASS